MKAEAAHNHPAVLSLDNFNLDTTIPGDADMRETAQFQIQPLLPFGSGVFLHLDSNLRVTSATADGRPIAWIQPRDPGRNPSPSYQGGWIYLQLPAAPSTPVSLRLDYHGKYEVVKVGSGNFMTASFGWYPYYPFGEPFHEGHYQLTFHCDKQYTVVATGVQTANTVEGHERTQVFRPSEAIAVAGFALGQYKEDIATVQLDGKPVALHVFANVQPDDLFASISHSTDLPGDNDQLAPGLENLSAVELEPTVVAEVSNSLRFMDAYFGPYPYQKLAVVNISGSYGQGWPSLLYLSSLSFLDSTRLHELGIPESGLRQLSDTFRAHETSHQWWGHLVRWAGPRDQWLSEGFANASALLYEQARFGAGPAKETLEEWRRDLFQRDQFGRIPVDEGPVWIGQRLSSTLDPLGYQTVVYDKGGYILYMLREMMVDGRNRANPDDRFMAMMHDFTKTYAGQAASTGDFKAEVEKYMTPVMDLDGNHTMDWFFNQFVYGVGVPTIQFDYTVAHQNGQSQVTLHMRQSPPDWKEVLPVTIHLAGKNHWLHGTVRVVKPDQTETFTIPGDVRSVVANENDEMMVVVTK